MKGVKYDTMSSLVIVTTNGYRNTARFGLVDSNAKFVSEMLKESY